MQRRALVRLVPSGLLAAVLWGLAVLPAGATALDERDADAYGAAFEAVDKDKWRRAHKAASAARDPGLREVLDWLDYRRDDTRASFAAIAGFIDAYPDWPYLGTLRTNAERRLRDGVAPEILLAWFKRFPPRTGRGALMHIGAQQASGEDIVANVRRAWVTLDFDAADSKLFYRRYREHLRRQDHIARLDRLIWSRQYGKAKRMLRLVGNEHRALGEARIALLRQTPGVDGAINRVPENLREDPALWYARLHWRRRKGKDESARAVLLSPSPSIAAAAALPRLGDWYAEREVLARRALAQGHYSEAYRLVADHSLDEGTGFAEGEFMAGWIAHAFLSDHDVAADHFERLHAGVRYPISRARGAYWTGRAAAALGDSAAARTWFDRAAEHPTTFYGQQAITALDLPLPETAPAPAPDDADRAWRDNHAFTPLVRQLAQVDAAEHTSAFLYLMGRRAKTPGARTAVAELAREVGRPKQALTIAKRAVREGEPMTEFGYPLIELPPPDGVAEAPEPALILALVRQESSFETDAESPAGARGLTQVMPRTAKAMARQLGVRYAKGRLTDDGDYNLRLGRAYLARLLARFDDAYPLALAGYNAGPGRVNQWMRAYGDPRTGEIDMLDWIESIPYDETRNYVQRVLEAVPIYWRRLGDRPGTSLAARGAG